MADAASGSNAAAAAVAAPAKKSPSEFLKGVIGRPVTVRLNSGVDYKGAWPFVLLCFRRPRLQLSHRATSRRDKEILF